MKKLSSWQCLSVKAIFHCGRFARAGGATFENPLRRPWCVSKTVIIPCSQYANINLNPSPNPSPNPNPNPNQRSICHVWTLKDWRFKDLIRFRAWITIYICVLRTWNYYLKNNARSVRAGKATAMENCLKDLHQPQCMLFITAQIDVVLPALIVLNCKKNWKILRPNITSDNTKIQRVTCPNTAKRNYIEIKFLIAFLLEKRFFSNFWWAVPS